MSKYFQMFMTTWMEPENTMLNEISPMEKVKNHITSLICGRENWKQQTHKNKQKLIDTSNTWGREDEKEVVKCKRGQIMVTEGDLTFMVDTHYADDIL